MKNLIKSIVIQFFKRIRRFRKKLKLIGHYHPKIQESIVPPPTFLGEGDDGGFGVDLRELKDSCVLYSFGVGKDISFDISVSQHCPKMEIHLFDPTPNSIDWIKKQDLPEYFHFHPVGLSDKDGTEEFFIPTDPKMISGSTFYRETLNKNSLKVKMSRLSSLMQELGHNTVDLLKLDIEGSEFKVIPDILQSGVYFKQLCIETHNRFFSDGDFKLKELISNLNDHGYYITYVSEFEDVLLFEYKNLLLH